MRTHSKLAHILASLTLPVTLAACAAPYEVDAQPGLAFGDDDGDAAGAGGTTSSDRSVATSGFEGLEAQRGDSEGLSDPSRDGTQFIDGELLAEDTCPGAAHILETDVTKAIAGTTEGLTDDYHSFCGDTSATADAPDAVYAFTIAETSTVRMRAMPGSDSPLDPSLNISTSACGTVDFCMNFGSAGSGGETFRGQLEAGTFYVTVDGASGTSGAFNLDVTASAPVCGDGVINTGEQCDPGVGVAGDGCGDPAEANECMFEVASGGNDACSGAAVVNVAEGADMMIVTGHTTTGYENDYDSNVCGGWLGRDRVYEIVPAVTGTLEVTIGLDEAGEAICAQDIYDLGCWDYVLYSRATCEDSETETTCGDLAWDSAETITMQVTADTPVWVFVEGYDDGIWSHGSYNLHATLTAD